MFTPDPKLFRNLDGTLSINRIFIEFKYIPEQALYSLDLKDKVIKGKTFPSLYRLYIEMSDVSEYTFANTYFESYQHWQAICEQEYFKPHIARWRKELELKIKSAALKEIIEQSQAEDPKKRLEASKYLYEKVFIDRDGSTRGRPSKKEIKEEALKQAQEQKLIDSHHQLMTRN